MKATKREKEHRLETNWRENPNTKSSGLLSKKVFTNALRSTNSLQPIVAQNGPTSAYSSITGALGFKHHEGTSRDSELRVIRTIMKRESQLMKLSSLCSSASRRRNSDRHELGNQVLEAMVQLRDLTVQYIEDLCAWRVSTDNFNPYFPRVFFWDDANYTLKIVNDLDALSDNDFLLGLLNISSGKILRNPLMLSNNLDEIDSDVEPRERAIRDARGASEGPLFEDRLRIRKAERIFLQELECELDSQPPVGSTDEQLSNSESVGFTRSAALAAEDPLRSWVLDAHVQLKLLEELRGEALISKSTHRLDTDFKVVDRPWTAEPTKLTQIESNIVALSRPTTSMSPETASTTVRSPGSPKAGRSRGNSRSGSRGTGEAQNILIFDEDNTAFSSRPSSRVGEQQTLRVGLDEDSVDGRNGQKPAYGSLDGNSLGEFSSLMSAGTSSALIPINTDDAALILNIATPPKYLALAGAITVIIMSGNDEVPADITWGAFTKLCRYEYAVENMAYLDPTSIPLYKVRAIKPFIKELRQFLKSNPEGSSKDTPVAAATRKFVKWVYSVGKVAIAPFVDTNRSSIEKLAKPPASRQSSKREASTAASNKRPTSKKRSDMGKLSPIKEREVQSPLKGEMVPVHTEVLDNVHVNPVLLSLLAPKPGTQVLESPKSRQRYDPNGLIESSSSYSDRYRMKIYDIITSEEASIYINTREYMNHLYDMKTKYTSEALKFYRPQEASWWIENLKYIVKVHKPNAKGAMSCNVSKNLIERLVAKGTGVELSGSVLDASTVAPSVDISIPMQSHSKYIKDLKSSSSSNQSSPTANDGGRSSIPAFTKSQRVEVNYRRQGSFYPGMITVVRGDGTYDIAYDDGEFESFVTGDLIKALEAAQVTTTSLPGIQAFKVDEIIEANYNGSNMWYSGRIAKVNAGGGSYDVAYDDGDMEYNVPWNRIRRVDVIATAATSTLQPATQAANPAPATDSASSSGNSGVKFQVGAHVTANYSGKGSWYEGKISRCNLDGTYDIAYDDGDSEYGVLSEYIKAIELTPKEPEFALGAHVNANYRSKGRYYPGRIASYNPDGTYQIDYDDGESENFVSAENIELIAAEPLQEPSSKSEPIVQAPVTAPPAAPVAMGDADEDLAYNDEDFDDNPPPTTSSTYSDKTPSSSLPQQADTNVEGPVASAPEAAVSKSEPIAAPATVEVSASANAQVSSEPEDDDNYDADFPEDEEPTTIPVTSANESTPPPIQEKMQTVELEPQPTVVPSASVPAYVNPNEGEEHYTDDEEVPSSVSIQSEVPKQTVPPKLAARQASVPIDPDGSITNYLAPDDEYENEFDLDD